jgi:hypothetical protein
MKSITYDSTSRLEGLVDRGHHSGRVFEVVIGVADEHNVSRRFWQFDGEVRSYGCFDVRDPNLLGGRLNVFEELR